MKKIYLLVSAVCIFVVASSSIAIKSSTGIAGYTGSPGGFGTCGNPGCHGGGNSSSSGMTISAVPAFVNDEFKPDSLYQISITASATGFTRYGFDCQVLTPSGANAGVISGSVAAGVKTLTAGPRRDAVHTNFKTGATVTWSFPWKAPSAAVDTAIIYAIANAVNGNGSTSGDFPLAPQKMKLSAAPPPVTVTAVGERAPAVTGVKVYPNPATVFASISFNSVSTEEIDVTVTDIKGRVLLRTQRRQIHAGPHIEPLDLRQLQPGAYFVQVNNTGGRLAQKLLIVN